MVIAEIDTGRVIISSNTQLWIDHLCPPPSIKVSENFMAEGQRNVRERVWKRTVKCAFITVQLWHKPDHESPGNLQKIELGKILATSKWPENALKENALQRRFGLLGVGATLWKKCVIGGRLCGLIYAQAMTSETIYFLLPACQHAAAPTSTPSLPACCHILSW